MSEAAPEFESGNGYFVKALNALGKYAQRHGIDPAGLPGWSQGEFGWTPPYGSAALDGLIKPWSLSSAAGGALSLNVGTVLQDGDDVEAEVTFSGNFTEFLPTDGQLIYLKVDKTSPTEGEIVVDDPWDDYPNLYETTGTGVSFSLSHYYFPLWRFYSEDGDGNRQNFSNGLWGLQLCDTHLKNINGLYKTGIEPILPVPVFLPASRAIPNS